MAIIVGTNGNDRDPNPLPNDLKGTGAIDYIFGRGGMTRSGALTIMISCSAEAIMTGYSAAQGMTVSTAAAAMTS